MLRALVCLRTGLRALAFGVACCLGPIAVPASAEPAPGSWLPLVVGNSWIYRSENDFQFKYPDRPIERRFWVGRVNERVDDFAASGDGEPSLYTIIRDFEQPDDVPRDSFSRRLLRALSEGSLGVRLHGLQMPDMPPPLNQAVRYAEPLVLLRDEMPVGASWKVGTWVLANFSVDLTATVVEREDVKVFEGSHPDSLVVRYTGPVSGSIEAVGEWALVDSGHYERTWWLAPGVGIVQEQVEITFRGTIAETRSIDGHITSRRELLVHETGR